TGPVRVGIVLGSDSDLEVLLEAVKVLDALDVGSEVVVASAHRTPERTQEYASTAHARGIGVLIAGAGGAAALPGVLASFSPLPVIGVPVEATPLGGPRVVTVDPQAPAATALRDAATLLKRGDLVAFPTETFYGLGAAALDPDAVKRIFELKGRPESKPLLALVDSMAMAEAVAHV